MHRWYPVAPHGRAEVEFEAPDLRFSGSAYHDVNEGDEPLEQAFAAWDWSRSELGEGRTAILYDVVDVDGQAFARGWSFDARGRVMTEIGVETLGPAVSLPRAGWGMERAIRCRTGHTPTLVATLEDSPFYTRNLVRTVIDAHPSLAVHESVDFRRFSSGKTQFLLPFKVRRA
jgi:carotenoid 1,2-hydratase